MPKCIKFISGFLKPNLDSEKFGEHLKWVDKSKNMFQIIWHHKGCPSWTEQEAEVFTEWDKHKGHFQPNDKTYYTKSKQRFRSLLYKLSLDGHLEERKCADKNKRIYCIVKNKKYKRKCLRNSEIECETTNEGASSFSEEDDSVHLDDIYRRKISEDDVVNVLEDHPYSIINSLPETDYEHNQEAQDYKNVSFHESSEFLEKRILVEKNSMKVEQANTLTPNNMNFMQLLQDSVGNDYNIENANQPKSSENLQNDPCFTSVCDNKPSEENTAFTDIVFNQNWELCDFSSDIIDMYFKYI